jgi:hypothetical protein
MAAVSVRCLAFCPAADACQAEMSRAVRFALWDYQKDQGLTAVCDKDVEAFCPKVRVCCLSQHGAADLSGSSQSPRGAAALRRVL